MAIYNIDNIRSINEDKSDIARYDATAKERARHRSLSGHIFKADKNSDSPKGCYHNEPSYKAAKRKYDDDVRKGRYGEQSANQYSNSFRRQLTTGRKQTARDKFIADGKSDQYIRELNKTNKLKEAAQYILDVLDEAYEPKKQEYYGTDSNFKIKGVPCEEHHGYTKELKEYINVAISNYNKLLKFAADELWEIDQNMDSRFKNSEALMRNLKLKYWCFDIDTENGEEVICFDFIFNTNPPLDKYHEYTLYFLYFPDTKKIDYYGAYQG